MKIASVAQIKSQFSAFVSASESSPVIITRNGRPVAVLLGMSDEDEIERLLIAYSPRVRAILEASQRELAAGRGIPHDRFWADVKKARPAKRSKRTRRKST